MSKDGKNAKRFGRQVRDALETLVRRLPPETKSESRRVLLRLLVRLGAERCDVPPENDPGDARTASEFQDVLEALMPPGDAASLAGRFAVAERIGHVYEELLEYDVVRSDENGSESYAVVAGPRRRKTGAHYTPSALADSLARTALEPLVLEGLSDGKPLKRCRLKSPREILSLKICDPAMGCGTFLLQACRRLAERLLKSQDAVRAQSSGPSDENLVDAMRLVAEHCLYGVDIDPTAVELARWSLRLITAAKGRAPVEFEPRLRCGDALLGVCPPRETTPSPDGAFRWASEFPDVFLREDGNGGFDAVLGNPPFMGGRKMRAVLGESYLNALKSAWPHASLNADLCAFFFLAGAKLLRQDGSLCFLATNTIAQGDTARTGLRFLTEREGFDIREAVSAFAWPGKATVVAARVAIYRGAWAGKKFLDGKPVRRITPVLDQGCCWGDAGVFPENTAINFQGSVLAGRGFLLTPAEAQRYLEADEKNRDVIFPFLGGSDLKSSPTFAASRFVIDFRDYSLERCEAEWPELLDRVRRLVKPERDRARRDAHRRFWWHHGDKRPALYGRIRSKKHVFAIVRHAKYLAPAQVPTDQVFQESLCLLDLPDWTAFAAVQSTVHQLWASRGSSTLGTGLRYTPSDYFDTFPFLFLRSVELEEIGRAYYDFRRATMFEYGEGLTAVYNRFHVPQERNGRMEKLRELRRRMDTALCAAYGWGDLTLDHDFRPLDNLPEHDRIRFTLGEATRLELLDRLARLNREKTPRTDPRRRLGLV